MPQTQAAPLQTAFGWHVIDDSDDTLQRSVLGRTSRSCDGIVNLCARPLNETDGPPVRKAGRLVRVVVQAVVRVEHVGVVAPPLDEERQLCVSGKGSDRLWLASAARGRGLSVECVVSYAAAVEAQVGRELVQVGDCRPERRPVRGCSGIHFGSRQVNVAPTARSPASPYR